MSFENDSLDDSFADPGVAPPPEWLRHAMELGLAAMKDGMTQIPYVGRETLPPRATLPSAVPKIAAPPAAPQRPPRDPVSQMRRAVAAPKKAAAAAAAKAAAEPSITASASKEDFDEFSQSMHDAHPATVAHSPVPQPDSAVGAAGKAQFRADWVPTISENLVDAKVKAAEAAKKPEPVPVAPVTPVAPIPLPAAAPVAPRPRPAYREVTQADRTARKTLFWCTIVIYVLSIGLGAFSAVRNGFSPLPRLGVSFALVTIQAPFLLMYLRGKRWAGLVVLIQVLLLALLIGTGFIGLRFVGTFMELHRNASLPQIPLWTMLHAVALLIGTALLVLGRQSSGRTGVAAAFLVASAGLMVPGSFMDTNPRLANPTTGPAVAELGDPARGYTFRKPDGFSGYRWEKTARELLLLTVHHDIPATEIFINEPYSLAFFHHISEDGPDAENISPSLASFLDGAEFLGRDGFELNGATYRSAHLRFEGDMSTPSICVTTTSTELEEGWLHVTVLAYEARFDGQIEAQDAAQGTLEQLLGAFDVSTPPPDAAP